MSELTLSRRALLGYAPALTFAAAAAPSLLQGAPAQAATLPPGLSPMAGSIAKLEASIDKAFSFQNFMMDAYASGSTVRLAQSYSDEALGATAFTYDNAVAIHAYLASEDADLLERAIILGDGLLYGQAHPYPFPLNDGRLPQAFFVNVPATDGSGAYVTPAAAPFYFYGSAVGDQAWAGMALAQLYARTKQVRFLTGALLLANWIVSNTYDTAGAGGYRFGAVIAYVDYNNVSQPSPNGKSTEHNIDTFAFFTMLSQLTGDAASASMNMKWSELAHHARKFVRAMYNPKGPYFYTGTLGDQITINTSPIPEDVQTWSYMALLNNEHKVTIDWALRHLEATDTAAAPHSSLTGSQSIRGLVFDTASLSTTADDPQAVWLEGTGHMIAALVARVLRGQDSLHNIYNDISTAISLVQQSVHAQEQLGVGKTAGGKAIPQGEGLVAATSVMDTGFGYTYGPSLHVGATGWYLLGVLAANPFQLGYRVIA